MNSHEVFVTRSRSVAFTAFIALFFSLFGSRLYAAPQAPTLEINKTIQDTSGNPISSIDSGVEFDYVMQYRCASTTEDCINATITDMLDSDLSWLSNEVDINDSTHIASSNFNTATGQVTWNFVSPLLAGSTGELRIRVRFPNGSTPNGTVATNTATMSADNATTVTSNQVAITATAASHIDLDKSLIGLTMISVDTNVTYKVELCEDFNMLTGQLDLSNITLVDTLPAGVIFVSASNGGSYNAGTNTVTWAIPDLDVSSNGAACVANYVTVRYPSGTFNNGDVVRNDASLTATPLGEPPVTLTDFVQHNIVSPTFNTQLSKNATWNDVSVGQTFQYGIAINNYGTAELDDVTIVDNVPPQLVVETIRLALQAYQIHVLGPIDIQLHYQTNLNGSWTAAPASPYTVSSHVDVAVSSLGLATNEVITAIRWTFDRVPAGFQQPATASDRSGYTATVINPDRNGNPVNSGDVITNCADATYVYGGSTTSLPQTCHSANVTVAIPTIALEKTSYTGLVIPGSTFRYELRIGSITQAALVNPTFSDLLHPDLEFVGFHDISDINGLTIPDITTIPNPRVEVIDNYLGTGRQLVSFHWNGAEAFTFPNPSQLILIRMNVRAKEAAAPGELHNTFCLSAIDGNDPVVNADTNYRITDVNDLDGDGNTTEWLACNSVYDGNITIQTNAAMDSLKLVKGQLDSDWTKYPDSGLTVPGGTADYRLVITNTGNISMTNISVVDILPFVGDGGVIDLSPRDTQWRPSLVGPVNAPSGVTVYYSTAQNPCRDEMGNPDPFPAGCTPANWSTLPPADITSVQSVRFDFGNTIMQPGDALELTWPMRAPLNAPTNGEIAWNSFGYVGTRVDNNVTLLPSEPIKVGIAVQPIQPAVYGNFVWEDTNRDGIQDGGELGIDGVRVELYQDNGDGICNPSNDTLVNFTITMDGGQYIFPNLPAGDYCAVFYVPPTHDVSPTNANGNMDEMVDSDGVVSTFNGFDVTITAVTTLIATEEDYTWDQGLYLGNGAVGNYVWFDQNSNGQQDEPTSNGINGVTVTLYDSNNNPVETQLTTNDVNGNPGFYLFDNLLPGDYSICFTLPVGATFTTQGATGSSDPTDSDVNGTTGCTEVFTVIPGQYDDSWDAGLIVPSGILSLGDRVWNDVDNDGLYEPASGEVGINGVRVNLYRDTNNNGQLDSGDAFVKTTTTVIKSGLPGYYEFTELPEGEYIVEITPSNFIGGGVLNGFISSTGNQPTPDPDDNVNNDDNGDAIVGFGVASQAITLSNGAESGDGDSNANHNPSVDFGFYEQIVGSISGIVWCENDTNPNTSYNPADGDTPINNVGVTLYGDGNCDGSADSSALNTQNSIAPTGYLFSNLTVGVVGAPVCYVVTVDQSDPDLGSCDTPITSGSLPIQLTETNPNSTNNNFGFEEQAPLYDYGDLKDANDGSQFPTAGSNGGEGDSVRHIISNDLYLGGCVDSENDGAPNNSAGLGSAGGDDNTVGATSYGSCAQAGDDEDGIAVVTPLIPGEQACIEVDAVNTTGGSAILQLWFDWDGSDSFTMGEEVTLSGAGVVANGGVSNQQYCFTVPATASADSPAYRARLSSTGGLDYSGTAANGEVEDYIQPTVCAGNLVWNDEDRNGQQDSGELGVDGLEMQLIFFGSDGTAGTADDLSYTTTTANGGLYRFCGLLPNTTYQINIPTPDLSLPIATTANNSTAGDVLDSDGTQAGGEGTAVTGPILTISAANFDGATFFNLPTGENGIGDGVQPNATDSSNDLTVDFGFYSTITAIALSALNTNSADTLLLLSGAVLGLSTLIAVLRRREFA